MFDAELRPVFGLVGSGASVGSAVLTWCGYISVVAGMIGAVAGAILGCVAVYDLAKRKRWFGLKRS